MKIEQKRLVSIVLDWRQEFLLRKNVVFARPVSLVISEKKFQDFSEIETGSGMFSSKGKGQRSDVMFREGHCFVTSWFIFFLTGHVFCDARVI